MTVKVKELFNLLRPLPPKPIPVYFVDKEKFSAPSPKFPDEIQQTVLLEVQVA